MQDYISALVNREIRDPEDNQTIDVFVKSVVIDDSLDGKEADLTEALDVGKSFAIVSDRNTYKALGHRIEKALGGKFKIKNVSLGDNPKPDLETVESLKAQISADVDALIAVGSGTINDLCKFVAFQLHRPYAVFGTAPSMNGYTSVNAAITVKGHKKTLPARAPQGVFLDLDVLSCCPERLIKAGLGDSLCRSTAQADWLLAHLFWGQPFKQLPFDLLLPEEDELFRNAEPLLAGDRATMRRLARTLVLSGFGMTICNSSQPASQGEHLISHYMDMMYPNEAQKTFHGEHIGVTTLTIAEIQEKILNRKEPPVLSPTETTRSDVIAHFGEELGQACWEEFQHKIIDGTKATQLNDKSQSDWNDLREKILSIMRPVSQLREILAKAKAPQCAEELGWSEVHYRNACLHAHQIRNRYTFLDLASASRISII